MSFSEQLIEKLEYAECPACGPNRIKLVEPDGKTLYCDCCGRTMEIGLSEGETALYLGSMPEWDYMEHPCQHKWPMPPPDPNAEPMLTTHWISNEAKENNCWLCSMMEEKRQATHVVVEVIPTDEPQNEVLKDRHPFKSYVCCGHFTSIFGLRVFCP